MRRLVEAPPAQFNQITVPSGMTASLGMTTIPSRIT
jgi:hypothetical protein